MAESLINMRVLFPKGKQKQLIDKMLSSISVNDAAKLCRFSERTIRDWRREKFLMDYNALKVLCKKVKMRIPSDIKLKSQYWYVTLGSRKGALAVLEKYGRIGGDPGYRQKKWREWWEKEGQYKPSPILYNPLSIRKPRKSKELAEFVGIVLGDGGITNNQIVITLNGKKDKRYSIFVRRLIKKLFDVPVSTYYNKKENVIDLTVSRRKLVRFCINELGLKIGNKVKQQVDIPNWIKEKEQYKIACARGLIDTDGCVFVHRYQVSGKWYAYKKISFSNRSKPLLESFHEILENIGLNPRITKGIDVRLDSAEDVKNFFRIIGSNNPRNLNKYLNKV